MSQKLWRKNQPTRNFYDLKGGDLCKQEKTVLVDFVPHWWTVIPQKLLADFLWLSLGLKKIARHFMSSSILSEYLT